MPARDPDAPRRNPGGEGRGHRNPGAAPEASAPGPAPESRGRLADARRYTPRGRTVRDTPESDRAGRGDPFRPALRVVDGGQRRSTRSRQAESEGPTLRLAARGRSAPGGQNAPTARGTATPRKGSLTRGVSPETAGRARRKPRPRAHTRPKGPLARVAAWFTRPPSRRRPPRLGDPARRLRAATALMMVFFVAIGARLVQIQVADAKTVAAQGLSDRLRTVELPAPRGTIYDRFGAILAHSVDARYVAVDPVQIKDPDDAANHLFELLRTVGISRSDILAKVTSHKRADGTTVRFEYLARGVNADLGEAVKALGIVGIDVGRDERRDVPNSDLAANVLGFTRKTDHEGLAGIEVSYNSLLRGIDGSRTFEVGESDLAKEIPGGYSHTTPARPGGSVQLTIDRDLQHMIQSKLAQQAERAKAVFACAVVIDTTSSEILAQASYPTFNAAKPGDSTERQRQDACTQVVYDPGSVHKVIVVGAALQEGKITPDTTVAVGPTITKGDQTYRDHVLPQGSTKPMTVPGILAMSSNVGTIRIADQLGPELIYDYQRRFGLGSPTGVGLPNEAPGQLIRPEQWTGSNFGSVPIGDGISVTGLQMASVYAAIANNGVWTQPRLVKAVIGPDGKKKPTPVGQSRTVMSAQHAQQLRTMLEAVTTLRYGPTGTTATGVRAAIDKYRVAGKTGTGLYNINGGYTTDVVSSFIGMAPADDPRFVISVVACVPEGVTDFSAAATFNDMMSFTLGQYHVPPTGAASPTFRVHPGD